jgi:hypothetical protein
VVVVDGAGGEGGGRLFANAPELVAASAIIATATDPTTSPAWDRRTHLTVGVWRAPRGRCGRAQ